MLPLSAKIFITVYPLKTDCESVYFSKLTYTAMICTLVWKFPDFLIVVMADQIS